MGFHYDKNELPTTTIRESEGDLDAKRHLLIKCHHLVFNPDLNNAGSTLLGWLGFNSSKIPDGVAEYRRAFENFNDKELPTYSADQLNDYIKAIILVDLFIQDKGRATEKTAQGKCYIALHKNLIDDLGLTEYQKMTAPTIDLFKSLD